MGYTFQLYFDFSGYSDMAIGLARLAGIMIPMNFNSPYKAASVIDFWRRWHVTLSRFLRDYLYIPLGGNRKGEARRHVNIMITMLLGGLWHGAGWTFVIWGGMHGALLVANNLYRKYLRPGREDIEDGFVYRLLAWATTFLLVVAAWVFFRAENTGSAVSIVRAMAGLASAAPPGESMAVFSLAGYGWVAGLLFIARFMPNTQEIMADFEPALDWDRADSSWSILALRWKPAIGWALATALMLGLSLIRISETSEFLYFQF